MTVAFRNPLMNSVATFGDLVKFSHTIFLFPFALSALLLATREHPLTLGMVFWVVVALVTAVASVLRSCVE